MSEQKEQEQSVLLPVDVFNAVTDYLSNRPYREVAGLINEIRQGAKVVEVPEETEETVDE